MPRANTSIYGFNGGVISKAALTRADMERVRVSCEQMNNWMPKVIGEMSTRPGMQYLFSTKSDGQGKLVPFIYSASQTALIELTNGIMRVIVSDALVTRVSVSAAINNGTFTGSLTGWTDDDAVGAVSQHASNMLELTGTGTSYARRYQLVTLGVGDSGKVHALKIVVNRGPVKVRVGSTATATDYMVETTLRTGRHSLSFTPTGNFYVVLYSKDNAKRYVDSCEIEAAGTMELVAPWNASEVRSLRFEQSGDVIFCAVNGKKQQRIERHSFTSWSIVDYDTADGPFRLPNFDTGVTITPSAVSGNITLTASEPLFDILHVGSIWQLTHAGQTATATLTGADQYTGEIRVTGVNDATTGVNTRQFTYSLSGISGTTVVTLQRSIGVVGAWEDVANFGSNTSAPYSDTFSNQIVYYRLGIKTGNYNTGTITATLAYTNSSQIGVVRITDFTSSTSVLAEVVSTLGKASATSEWREGYWSYYRGYPSSVTIYDGRLWWGMLDLMFGSVSDAYESYDQATEGDAGPIIRSISIGPVEGLLWMVPAQRLLTGSASQEVSVRSSSFDEPLTPTKFTARKFSSRGSANIAPAAIDSSAVYVQRDGRRIFEASYVVEAQDYVSRDLTRLSADICNSGAMALAVQRQPDTRIISPQTDGTISSLLLEKAENVAGWFTADTDGIVEDVAVLPGTDEDRIYHIVRRTINGSTKRYVEKLAKESEARNSTSNKTADAFVVWAGGATTTVTGLSHLEGKQVTVWYNGAAVHDQNNMVTVSGGQITTASTVNAGAVIGLPYTSRYKSMKLAFAAGLGTALLQRKRVDHVGFLLNYTAWKGFKFGRDFSNLTALPKLKNGTALADTAVLTDYDYDMSSFAGGWSTDARVCIEVKSPYAATVQGMVVAQVTNDKDGSAGKEAA